MIASLSLFRKITDWNKLYRLAKKEKLLKEIGALYEISRKTVTKVKKMPERFKNLARKKALNFSYIINKVSSNDFGDTEKKWKVYIPLNLSDLEDYKR